MGRYSTVKVTNRHICFSDTYMAYTYKQVCMVSKQSTILNCEFVISRIFHMLFEELSVYIAI